MRGGDFPELTAFVTVAETQSFVRAASRLGLSRSALSHMIRALEERVGTRLLNRTTRSVSLTDAGRTLFARLPAAFAEIKDAVDGLSVYRERPAGTVRLNLARGVAEVLLASKLPAFAAAYPDIRRGGAFRYRGQRLRRGSSSRRIASSGHDSGPTDTGRSHRHRRITRIFRV